MSMLPDRLNLGLIHLQDARLVLHIFLVCLLATDRIWLFNIPMEGLHLVELCFHHILKVEIL